MTPWDAVYVFFPLALAVSSSYSAFFVRNVTCRSSSCREKHRAQIYHIGCFRSESLDVRFDDHGKSRLPSALCEALSSDVRWRASTRCCRKESRVLDILARSSVGLTIAIATLGSQRLYIERRARPGFVQCVTLAFHVDTRIIQGITETRHVELPCQSWSTTVCRIRDAADQLVDYV